MTHEESRSVAGDLAYLAACALDGRTPDASRVNRMDTELLYKTADRHMMTGITAMALESAGVRDESFTQAKGKAIRKAAVFDIERKAVTDALEEAGIRHMPMKGSVLKDLYPVIGMRQMADVDILYDPARTADVRAIMEGLGFSADENNGRGIHDIYFKPPVCCFEMHRGLIGTGHNKLLTDYYKDAASRLIPDTDSTCGFHLRDEDFYIYMLAHEYKHYSEEGTGLRPLMDTYVYIGKKGGTLDWQYINGELEKLGLADFEAENRSLAMHLFGGEELSGKDLEMLDFLLNSGAFGSVGNLIKNRIAEYRGKPFGMTRYVFSRIFLPLDKVRTAYPAFIKCPILLPFLPFYRVIRGITTRRGSLRAELKALAECGKQQST